MHCLQLGIADVSPDRRNAARLAIGMLERIDHRAVVGAVTGGLHDDVAREAEMIAQGK
jgi:hypothetical protein